MTNNYAPAANRKAAFWQGWGVWIGCLVLVAGTLAVYWPVIHFEFLNFDDPDYITNNFHIRDGITWEALKWAFHTHDSANWHPLTWISHMLDCQLYGQKPGGHHATSVLLHLINSCLLFALLMRMTGRRGASFVVAALFAWHPLHVESVAWVSERKDVLSTCFGFLTILAYVAYTRQRDAKDQKSIIYYSLALLCFALGLMAKPMLVTLPFLLLLLDYWPLERVERKDVDKGEEFRPSSWPRLALEKAPFLLLAALSCGVTFWAQKAIGAVVPTQDLPLDRRIGNAVLSYSRYIGKTLWPTHLAAFYPYGGRQLTWAMGLAGAALLVISAIALYFRRCRYLAVGWFWFVGTLVPVIGLVQVGEQAMADRYMYLPAVGLFIVGVFWVSDLAARLPHGKAGQAAMAGLALVACLAVTQRQLLYWHDSEALFRHAIDVTEGNRTAYMNLGSALMTEGKFKEAAAYFLQVIRGLPNYATGHANMGDAYRMTSEPAKAIAEYQTALRLDPNNVYAHCGLGAELLAAGDAAGAIEHLRAALAVNPYHAAAHYYLARALMRQGEVEGAYLHYRAAIQVKPDWLEALNGLAWELATQPEARFRNGKEAVELAAHSVALTHTNEANTLDTLGAAYAEMGNYPEAVKTARAAAGLAQAAGQERLAKSIQEHLQRYERNEPFREPVPPLMKPQKNH